MIGFVAFVAHQLCRERRLSQVRKVSDASGAEEKGFDPDQEALDVLQHIVFRKNQNDSMSVLRVLCGLSLEHLEDLNMEDSEIQAEFTVAAASR